MQVMYGVGGEHDLSERELGHLTGWRGSRPVRVGNGAWDQHQHDVFGAVLDAVYRFREQISEFEPRTVDLLARMADAAAVVWREPDHGMWEVRGEPRNFLHSRLMCWVALDRAVRLADQLGLPERAAGWSETAETVRAAILEQGWSERASAFTQSFGDDRLDASGLMLAITGFLPAADPRCGRPSTPSPASSRRRAACSTGTLTRTGCRAGSRRFYSAATGWPSAGRSPASSTRSGRSSDGPPPTPTT